jgi:ceramide glucosyltransferase
MVVLYAMAMILSGIAAVITTLQTAVTLLFRRRGRFFGPGPRVRSGSSGPFRPGGFFQHRPMVSILKPVCGVDDDLEVNLESFASLRGVAYEVIVSIADQNDAALPIVERVIRRHPAVSWKLVIGGDGGLERGNRKVARLIAAMPHAIGSILFISDSNVRVRPYDIARTVRALDDPRTGCVSNLFTACGAESVGASIESLHLLSFVVPGSVSAAAVNVPCVVGKSMAIRRDILLAIGGFGAFARVLAEDQAIGLAVRDAGYDVVLSPVVVRNVVMRRTLRRALGRQIRWNKIRYAYSRPTYCAEMLLFPLPFAILAAVGHPTAFALPAAVVLLRMMQVALLANATHAELRFRELLYVPLFDLLHFAAQFVPYVDNRVTWRGYSTRIGPGTTLIDVAIEESAAA